MGGDAPILSVVQLNAWLLAFPFFAYSKHYEQRRGVLAGRLAATGADVISLQEVWRNRDKDRLESELRTHGYRYFLFTRHRFGFGDGLFLASKLPIRRATRGRPFRTVTRFIEFFPAKRAVAATLEHPDVGEIDFYQTHLGSVLFDPKRREHPPESRRKLLVQLLEVAEFVGKHRRSDFAVLTGDLNFHYQAYDRAEGYGARYADEYTRFLQALDAVGLAFENSFLAANGRDVTHPAVPTYSQENPYARAEFAAKPEETLDYVLYTPHPRWRARESRIAFRERVSDEVPALSDHYGIHTVFEFSSPEKR